MFQYPHLDAFLREQARPLPPIVPRPEVLPPAPIKGKNRIYTLNG